MSSLRNALPRRAHKERSQPDSRKKFGLLEKHKDYVERARDYHQKEQVLQKLKEKAAFRNPDEINSKTVGGVHKLESEANKYNHYTKDGLKLMKTQDIGYILQKLQAEKKKVERLSATLRLSIIKQTCLLRRRQNKHPWILVNNYYETVAFEDLSKDIKKNAEASYKELKSRKNRVKELEKIYTDMTMQKELQKKGKKRKLREDEIVTPTSRPVYKWRQERKR